MMPDEPSREVPLVGYSEIALRLDNVFDAINAVNETLIAVNSASNSKPRPNRAPRPKTAVQRTREVQSLQRLMDLEQQLTGGR